MSALGVRVRSAAWSAADVEQHEEDRSALRARERESETGGLRGGGCEALTSISGAMSEGSPSSIAGRGACCTPLNYADEVAAISAPRSRG